MLNLSPFARQVRFVRAWKSAAIGATLGAAGAAGWATASWLGKADPTPAELAIAIAGSAVLGAIVGAVKPVKESALRASVDRRAGLENRLTASAVEVEFADEIRADAESKLANVKPSAIYPVRLGRWHAGALAATMIAASIFLIGSTPILLSPQEKAARAELAKKGKVLERITKESFKDAEVENKLSPAERRLMEDARRLQRDLERNRIKPEEALQKANELQQQALELAKKGAQDSQKFLQQAETAMEKMERAELAKAGLSEVSPQMLQMPQAQRSQMKAEAEKQLKDIQRQLAEIQNRLAEIKKKLEQKGLSEEERKKLEAEQKALEAQRKRLEEEAKAAKELADALKLSERAKGVLEKMRNHAVMEEIRALAQKMAKQNQQAAKSGQPKLTKAQLEELRQKMEDLLAQLQDDAAMEAYLKDLLEAMKNAGECQGQCMRPGSLGSKLASLLGIRGGAGIDDDDNFMDSGRVNMLNKPEEGKGKTFATSVTGTRRETGEESYIEIKAPTMLGNRTSVPYKSVLPSYNRKAEEALNRKEIPKEHEKRVREYFKSLTK